MKYITIKSNRTGKKNSVYWLFFKKIIHVILKAIFTCTSLLQQKICGRVLKEGRYNIFWKARIFKILYANQRFQNGFGLNTKILWNIKRIKKNSACMLEIDINTVYYFMTTFSKQF